MNIAEKDIDRLQSGLDTPLIDVLTELRQTGLSWRKIAGMLDAKHSDAPSSPPTKPRRAEV